MQKYIHFYFANCLLLLNKEKPPLLHICGTFLYTAEMYAPAGTAGGRLCFSRLIRISNRTFYVFPAKSAPCFVKALDHISPLCSAGFALPDTNFARISLKASYLRFVLSAPADALIRRKCLKKTRHFHAESMSRGFVVSGTDPAASGT